MVTNFEAKESVDKLIRYCTEHDCKTECAIRETCMKMKDESYLFHLESHMPAKEKTQGKNYIERMKDESNELVEKYDKLNTFRCRHCTQLDITENYLMRQQLKVMDEYFQILEARITHAIVKEKANDK